MRFQIKDSLIAVIVCPSMLSGYIWFLVRAGFQTGSSYSAEMIDKRCEDFKKTTLKELRSSHER